VSSAYGRGFLIPFFGLNYLDSRHGVSPSSQIWVTSTSWSFSLSWHVLYLHVRLGSPDTDTFTALFPSISRRRNLLLSRVHIDVVFRESYFPSPCLSRCALRSSFLLLYLLNKTIMPGRGPHHATPWPLSPLFSFFSKKVEFLLYFARFKDSPSPPLSIGNPKSQLLVESYNLCSPLRRHLNKK